MTHTLAFIALLLCAYFAFGLGGIVAVTAVFCLLALANIR